MKINRLFEIVYILLNKKQVTTTELAAHFEVSRRTILRDIEILSQAGIPIYTVQGKGGGVSILDHFVLNKTTVSDEEQNQILFALQSLASTEQMEVRDICSRLQVLFDKTDTNWIEVDFSRWGNQKTDKEKFELLKRAVIGKQEVSFLYSSSDGKTAVRTVCPLKLVFKSKEWYLQAYCLLKEGYRTFKINRMSSIENLEISFAHREFSPPPIDGPEGDKFTSVHLKLKFSCKAAYRVYDEFDPENIVRNDDGSFFAELEMPDGRWLYGYLLSFGTSVQVIEPRRVRENLLAEVENIRKSLLNL